MVDRPQKICLVCMDRTGSNMISSRLNTHKNIFFYNEIFHREFVIFQDDRVVTSKDILSRRDRDPSAFVSQVWNGDYEHKDVRPGIEAIGFKLFLNHNAEALRFVTNSGAKIIFLRRRNPLLRFSSFMIANKTGKWKSLSRDEKSVKVEFKPTEFRAYYNNYHSLETLYEMTLNRWNVPYFDLWYEDLVSDNATWEALVSYLGYDTSGFDESPLVRQNPTDPLARFTNPGFVENYLRECSKLEWLQAS